LYGVTELESYNLLDAVSLQYGMLEQERDKMIRTYVRDRFEDEPGLILAETLKAYNVTNRRSIDPSHSVAETHRDILLDILSDARAAAPMVQTANFHSSANPKSYFYVFSHKSEYGDYAGVSITNTIVIIIIYFYSSFIEMHIYIKKCILILHVCETLVSRPKGITV
jgi:hypothetical protein